MRQMTQFYAIVGTMMALGTTLTAQVRSCDLEISINSPTNNAPIAPKDTAWLEFTVKNNGPDPIMATDTLWFWDKTNLFPFLAVTSIPAKTTKAYTKSALNLNIV